MPSYQVDLETLVFNQWTKTFKNFHGQCECEATILRKERTFIPTQIWTLGTEIQMILYGIELDCFEVQNQSYI